MNTILTEKNFKYIPMWKVIESMENGKDKLPADTFKNKVVFVPIKYWDFF